MIRFKDVTKVVLVLALCFGFAGIGNAGKVCTDGICYREPTTVEYEDGTTKFIDVDNRTILTKHPEAKKKVIVITST